MTLQSTLLMSHWVIGAEARGFLVGTPVAKLGAGFVPA